MSILVYIAIALVILAAVLATAALVMSIFLNACPCVSGDTSGTSDPDTVPPPPNPNQQYQTITPTNGNVYTLNSNTVYTINWVPNVVFYTINNSTSSTSIQFASLPTGVLRPYVNTKGKYTVFMMNQVIGTINSTNNPNVNNAPSLFAATTSTLPTVLPGVFPVANSGNLWPSATAIPVNSANNPATYFTNANITYKLNPNPISGLVQTFFVATSGRNGLQLPGSASTRIYSNGLVSSSNVNGYYTVGPAANDSLPENNSINGMSLVTAIDTNNNLIYYVYAYASTNAPFILVGYNSS